MHYYYLMAFMFYFLAMIITFNDSYRRSNWYIYVSLGLNTAGSIFWFLLVKYLNDNDKILIHSAYWDLMILIISFLLPTIIYKFNFNLYQIGGLIFIFLGFAIVKWFHNQ